MNYLRDFIARHSVWIICGIGALLLLKPAVSEFNTILLVIVFEFLATGLSGVAAWAFTKIDFTREFGRYTLGLIFLGVHLCVGLTVLGVYIAQFSI